MKIKYSIIVLVALLLCATQVASAVLVSGISADKAAFNPNNGPVTISYTLEDTTNADIALHIYDPSNIEVKTIDGGTHSAGTYSIQWDGTGTSGIVPSKYYTARIVATGMNDPPDYIGQWAFNEAARPPTGVAVDSGYVYVLTGQNGYVVKCDASGNELKRWVVSTGVGRPDGIAVGGGYVYVADTFYNKILKYDTDGNYLGAFEGFNTPRGVAVDVQGNIYVADSGNNRIVELAPDGIVIDTFYGDPSSGLTGYYLNQPSDIAVFSSGIENTIYIADTGNNLITVYQNIGGRSWRALAGIDVDQLTTDPFNQPEGVAVDAQGNLYVADTGNNRIVKFTGYDWSDGTINYVTQWGSLGTGDLQFNGPQGIAADSQGNVYVADTQNQRVVKYNFAPAIASVETTIKVDTTWAMTDMTVAPPADSGWYTSDVLITLVPSDVDDAASVLETGYMLDGADWTNYENPFLVSGDGAHTINFHSVDPVGNAGSVQLWECKIDATPPVVSIATPAKDAVYTLGQPVLASWTTSDATSGIASTTYTQLSGQPIDTGTPGVKEFTVTATDAAGNTNSVTYHYTVAYAATPVTPSSSKVTQMKLGSGLPVKVVLKDASGNLVTNANIQLYVAKQTGSGWDEQKATSLNNPKNSNVFRYDAPNGLYLYNLDTKALSIGTWELRIKMDDATIQTMTIKIVK